MLKSEITTRLGRVRSSGRVLAFWLLPLLCSVTCARPRHVNVLLVTIDTLRADRVGCYGDTGAHTPNLDRVAREGIEFDHAVTPIPVTCPSHSTILTGYYPLHHTVRNNGRYVLPPGAVTLAGRFHDAGYRTGAFVSAFVLNRQFGLSQGFEAYDDSLFNERAGSETVRRALRWLSRRDPRPFFLWVHLYEPHTPWTPPMPYAALPLRSGYEREIAAADGAFGALLDRLRAGNELDRTLVVVLADHGEGLNDHGELEHGVFLYQETTRIPLLMRLPGGREAGRHVGALVSTVDLAPTVCEIAGVPAPPDEDGVTLVPALHGRALTPRAGVYLETLYPKENFGWAPLTSFENSRWQWIRAPEPELYQLQQDPQERNNQNQAQPDTSALMSRRLERVEQNMKRLGGSRRGPSRPR